MSDSDSESAVGGGRGALSSAGSAGGGWGQLSDAGLGLSQEVPASDHEAPAEAAAPAASDRATERLDEVAADEFADGLGELELPRKLSDSAIHRLFSRVRLVGVGVPALGAASSMGGPLAEQRQLR